VAWIFNLNIDLIEVKRRIGVFTVGRVFVNLSLSGRVLVFGDGFFEFFYLSAQILNLLWFVSGGLSSPNVEGAV
jgi:hypothetical protein